MYQSHDRSFYSGSVVAGKILSVVVRSTLATRELSSSRIRRPQRISAALMRPPPFLLRSAGLHPPLRHPSVPPIVPPHGQPSLVELQLVQPRENPVSSPRRAAVAIREVANPSTERRTATYDHLLIEGNSDRSRSHYVTSIPHPPSYYSANYAWNSPSRASRRPTAEPPSTTDRHRPPSDP
jgi:hypothetical protein